MFCNTKSDLFLIYGCNIDIFDFVSVMNVWGSIDDKEDTAACRMHMSTPNEDWLVCILLFYFVTSVFNLISHVILYNLIF